MSNQDMASVGIYRQRQLLPGSPCYPWHNKQGACMSVGEPGRPYRRVIMFVDNAGADILLGMVPLAR